MKKRISTLLKRLGWIVAAAGWIMTLILTIIYGREIYPGKIDAAYSDLHPWPLLILAGFVIWFIGSLLEDEDDKKQRKQRRIEKRQRKKDGR